jgi:hypothetical protein
MAFSDIAYAGPAFQQGVQNLSGLIEQQRKAGREVAYDVAAHQKLLMEAQSRKEATELHGKQLEQMTRQGRITEAQVKEVEQKQKIRENMYSVREMVPEIADDPDALARHEKMAKGMGFRFERVGNDVFVQGGYVQDYAQMLGQRATLRQQENEEAFSRLTRKKLQLEEMVEKTKGKGEKGASDLEGIQKELGAVNKRISSTLMMRPEIAKEVAKQQTILEGQKVIEEIKQAGKEKFTQDQISSKENIAEKNRASRESEGQKNRASREKNVAARVAAPSKTPQSLIESLSKQVVEQGEESLTPNQRAALRLRTGADAKTVSAVENVLKNNINFTGADAETQASMMATTYQLRKNLLGDVQEESKITPRERKFLEDARKRPANKNVPEARLLEFFRETYGQAEEQKSH